MKFIHEENSTEAASIHSPEKELEEQKHMIYTPAPLKDQSLTENINLSNIIRSKSRKSVPEGFATPNSNAEPTLMKITANEANNMDIEEVQRQKILNVITYNTLMLNNVMMQQKNYSKSLQACIEMFKSFRDEQEDGQKTHIEKIEQIKKEKSQSTAFDSNPTPLALFKHLFGVESEYKYELVLDNDVPAPIFRERNLIVRVRLVNMATKDPVRNKNRTLLHLALQTWEIPSNPILRNKTGNKAIMGETEIELVDGVAVFDRIQINEVTSKFIHGYIAMLVIPSKPINYGTSLKDQGQDDNYISYELIKPLMLEKVVVKSKKKNTHKKKEPQNE